MFQDCPGGWDPSGRHTTPVWSVPSPPNHRAGRGSHSHSQFTQSGGQSTNTNRAPTANCRHCCRSWRCRGEPGCWDRFQSSSSPNCQLSKCQESPAGGERPSTYPVPGAALSVISFNPRSNLRREALPHLLYGREHGHSDSVTCQRLFSQPLRGAGLSPRHTGPLAVCLPRGAGPSHALSQDSVPIPCPRPRP